MNMTLQLQELDKLIVGLTKPPVTTKLRSKLSMIIEQSEAYPDTAAELEAFKAKYVNQSQELAALKDAQAVKTPAFKAYLCPYCGQSAAELKAIKTGPSPQDQALEIAHNYYHCHKCEKDWNEERK